MRVKNAYTATLGVPGAGELAPGASGDADGSHHVVKLWCDAGMLVVEEPGVVPLAELQDAVAAVEDSSKSEGRRRRGG